MDNERLEAVAALISADVERRLVKEIIGDLSLEERRALREKAITHMLEGLKTSVGTSLEYNLRTEIEQGLRDHVRKLFNEKYAEPLKTAVEESLRRYFQPPHIDKIVDTQAPTALAAAVKKVVDRVALSVASARPGST
jgi:hypothetical protein